jgi:hypothetical protein
MNIEQLIPKETTDRDSFIRNIIIPDENINYLGIDFTLINFKFKTNIPITKHRQIISYKGIDLTNLSLDNTWGIVSNDPNTYLPKEYLLEEWEVV